MNRGKRAGSAPARTEKACLQSGREAYRAARRTVVWRAVVWRSVSAALPLAAMVAADALTGPARGQEPAPGAFQLDPVTVTARKRMETENEVPIGMSVLPGRRLDAPPSATNAAIARGVPNFSLIDVGGQAPNFANIRGIGSFSPLAPDDTSVVFHVDEVPQSVYGLAPSLLDVERVEVLRGPQGTLFGRNTQGGAVNIVARRPAFEQSLALTGEIGSNGHRLGAVVANAVLVPDWLAARLAVRYSSFDGDIPNTVLGEKDATNDIGALRGAVLFAPSSATTLSLSVTYNRSRDTAPRFMLRDGPDFPSSAVSPRTLIDGESYGVTLRLKHDFGPFLLETLSSFQRGKSLQRIDLTDAEVFAKLTGLPASFFNAPGSDLTELRLRERLYGQELRLSSARDSAIAWTVGFNFFRSELWMGREGRASLPSFALLNGAQDNVMTTSSYAGFGEATVPVLGALKATFGLRAAHETKSARFRFVGNGAPGVVPAYAQDASLGDSFVTGRAILSYDWRPGLMTYASVSRGHVSAGFPALTVNSPFGKPESAFPESTSWTYEAGFKATLFDRRLTVNAAAFYNDVKRGHLVVFDPGRVIYTTAALDYRSVGGEIEATAQPLRGVELFAGLGYTYAELVSVPAGSLTGARDGNRVPNVPRVTASVGAQYRFPLRLLGVGGHGLVRVTYHHVGARAADVANGFALRAYDIVDAKIGWESASLDVYGFASNLFDARYETFGQSFGAAAQTVRVGQSRVLGVGATLRF